MKYGVYPMDFILEAVLRAGLDWFKTDPLASDLVFGQLDQPYLARYGTDKIAELKNYIETKEVKIVQSLRLVDASLPYISIQLGQGMEDESKASLDDSMGDQFIFNQMSGDLEDTDVVGYSPIKDNILLGIHGGETPDLPKYLYMLVVYILNSYKYDLITKGIYLGTFSMTDMSRMNDYLPDNVFSRFMTFSAHSNAPWKKGSLPQLDLILDGAFESIAGDDETEIT
jgi:hypothetical protein